MHGWFGRCGAYTWTEDTVWSQGLIVVVILGDKSLCYRWYFLTLKPGIPGGPGGPGGHRAGHCREQKHLGLTAHPGRLLSSIRWKSHVDFGSKSIKSNGTTASNIDHHFPMEWSPRGPDNPQNNDLWVACSTLNRDCETFWKLTLSKMLKNPSFPVKLDQFLVNHEDHI